MFIDNLRESPQGDQSPTSIVTSKMKELLLHDATAKFMTQSQSYIFGKVIDQKLTLIWVWEYEAITFLKDEAYLSIRDLLAVVKLINLQPPSFYLSLETKLH